MWYMSIFGHLPLTMVVPLLSGGAHPTSSWEGLFGPTACQWPTTVVCQWALLGKTSPWAPTNAPQSFHTFAKYEFTKFFLVDEFKLRRWETRVQRWRQDRQFKMNALPSTELQKVSSCVYVREQFEIMNLLSVEIGQIFRFKKYDLRIKVNLRTANNLIHRETHFQCFLKCVGENGGLVNLKKYSQIASNLREIF